MEYPKFIKEAVEYNNSKRSLKDIIEDDTKIVNKDTIDWGEFKSRKICIRCTNIESANRFIKDCIGNGIPLDSSDSYDFSNDDNIIFYIISDFGKITTYQLHWLYETNFKRLYITDIVNYSCIQENIKIGDDDAMSNIIESGVIETIDNVKNINKKFLCFARYDKEILKVFEYDDGTISCGEPTYLTNKNIDIIDMRDKYFINIKNNQIFVVMNMGKYYYRTENLTLQSTRCALLFELMNHESYIVSMNTLLNTDEYKQVHQNFISKLINIRTATLLTNKDIKNEINKHQQDTINIIKQHHDDASYNKHKILIMFVSKIIETINTYCMAIDIFNDYDDMDTSVMPNTKTNILCQLDSWFLICADIDMKMMGIGVSKKEMHDSLSSNTIEMMDKLINIVKEECEKYAIDFPALTKEVLNVIYNRNVGVRMLLNKATCKPVLITDIIDD